MSNICTHTGNGYGLFENVFIVSSGESLRKVWQNERELIAIPMFAGGAIITHGWELKHFCLKIRCSRVFEKAVSGVLARGEGREKRRKRSNEPKSLEYLFQGERN